VTRQVAYSSAPGRGAAVVEDEVTDYAPGEFRRLATLIRKPGAQAAESPPGTARRNGRE
jgi:hypothetical protein